jgi:hypothetical protein
MYGPPPVRKRFRVDGQKRSASMYPAFFGTIGPWPRWVAARLGPHKPHGYGGHFLNQASKTPVRPFVHLYDRARRQDLFLLVTSVRTGVRFWPALRSALCR